VQDDHRSHADSPDEALTRLEDALLGYPYDRALPDLATILDDAGVTAELLTVDDRAAKLLHEAIVARPLSSLDAVAQLRTEVELLTLEVQVLTERLAAPDADPDEAGRSAARLAAIRARLTELRAEL
jgi:hypothetical protein